MTLTDDTISTDSRQSNVRKFNIFNRTSSTTDGLYTNAVCWIGDWRRFNSDTTDHVIGSTPDWPDGKAVAICAFAAAEYNGLWIQT